MKNIVGIALKIAKKAHKGQFRHDGKTPYITHPIAVAQRFMQPMFQKPEDDILVSVALLHDVMEDSNIQEKELIYSGLPESITKCVFILTKQECQSYVDYILRVKADFLAQKVKIEDIKHNLSTLEPKNKTQRDKYLLALYILEH